MKLSILKLSMTKLSIIQCKQFPTTHRAFGIAFCSSTSRLAGALSPVVTAWYFFFFCIPFFVCFGISFCSSTSLPASVCGLPLLVYEAFSYECMKRVLRRADVQTNMCIARVVGV
jgi:hypothetical protein